ncbi:MAG: type III pantothenate kinase [Bacteroidales bacterium]|nr:type III pantothenate kinase [Bacteroidales bacterium]
MNLLIDIGNTSTKISIFDEEKEIFFDRYSTINKELISSLFCNEFFNLEKGIVSSVAKIPQAIIEIPLKYDMDLLVVDQETPVPIGSKYQTPESLGIDRIAINVAANGLYPNKNCLSIGIGTAITYDIIESNGVFAGGCISPGLNMRYKALHENTANLPYLKPSSEFKFPAVTTNDALYAGVQQGILFEIEGYINYFKNFYDDLIVILTGGDSEYFEKNIKKPIFVVPNLVNVGLNFILEYNVKSN